MPRKVFNYGLEMDGFDQFLIQTVKRPIPEVGKVKHGNYNRDDKTAGGYDCSDAEIGKIMPIGPDTTATDWLLTAQNPASGTGGLPEDYKRDVVFKEYDPDGVIASIEIWHGAWVCKVEKGDYKKGNQNENVIEKITLSVDWVEPVM